MLPHFSTHFPTCRAPGDRLDGWVELAVMGSGDYNHDGRSDILLQNSSGEVVVWEMNGASVIGGGSIANPGPARYVDPFRVTMGMPGWSATASA
jgi:hypothetical protein